MKNYSQKFLFLVLALLLSAGASFAQNGSGLVGSWSDSSFGLTNYQN